MKISTLSYAFIVSIASFGAATSNAQQAEPKPRDGIRAISPDGTYGVIVPNTNSIDDNNPLPHNQLMELESGNVLADINGKTGLTRSNNGSCSGGWSRDGMLLFWEVDGKWTSLSIALLKLKDSKDQHNVPKRDVAWQTNIVPDAQKAILSRTKEAAPKEYEDKKEENAGSGSDYPEGFTVDVRLDVSKKKPLALPLKVFVDLTSDPKGMILGPLESYLEGVVDEQGKFSITKFKMGKRPPAEDPLPNHPFGG